MIVGPHALAHDARRHADHVGVSDPPALDDADDGAASGQLSLLGLNTEDSGIRRFERCQDFGRRGHERPRGQGLDREARRNGAALGQRAVQACRDLAARAIGNERDALAGLDRQAGLDGVARARQQIG